MAVTSGTVAVSHTTATVIVPAANPNALDYAPNPAGNTTVVLTNLDGAITVYLGGSGVTSAGYQLLKGASVTLALGPSDAIYGLAASGTPNVSFITAG
jgi:hypothetical protein